MNSANSGAIKKRIQNAIVSTYVQDQLRVRAVDVEVCVLTGIPTFQIVGLPEKAVKESRERVKAAIMNSGYSFPLKKILVNLSPADLPKTGGYFDLPIAIAILIASGQVQRALQMRGLIWAGELSLLGRVTGKDLLAFAITAYRQQKTIILPTETELPNVLQHKNIYQVQSLCGAIKLMQKTSLSHERNTIIQAVTIDNDMPELTQITGRVWEKTVMMIAASGGHHLLLQGPPGVGKTLMAQCFTHLLPRLTLDQMLDVALIYSWTGQTRLQHHVPIRMPHHHVTPCALLGGGVPFAPGEISLAHHGVLFLDEITEYKRGLLDQLREALAQGCVHISRAARKITVEAKFQMVVAMNPCPCGNLGSQEGCICGHLEIKRHQKNISGPFLDRIDMGITLNKSDDIPPSSAQLLCSKWRDKLADFSDISDIQEQVRRCRTMQFKRQQVLNRDLSWQACQELVETSRQNDDEFKKNESQLGLQGRSWQKTIRIARTIADCEASELLRARHLHLAVALSSHRLVSPG